MADADQGAKRRTFFDFILLSGGESLSKVAGFIAFGYLGRTLTKEGYGTVETAASFVGFFSIMVDFGLGTIGAREAAKDRKVVPSYAALIPGARLLLGVLAVPAMLLLSYLIVEPSARPLVWLFAASLPFLVLNQRWLFQGIERMTVVAGAQLLRMVAFLAAVLLLVRSADDLLAVGYAEVGAVAIMALYFVGNQLRFSIPVRLAWPRDPLKGLFSEAWFVGLGQMVWAFNQHTPVLLIAGLVSATEVGVYGSANRIFVSLSTFSMLYHFNLFPTISRLLVESKEAFDRAIEASFRVTSWASVAVAVALTILAEEACTIAFGADFASSGPALAILAWSLPITLVSGHARWGLVACGQQRYGLVAQVGGAVVTAGLGFAMVAEYGAIGAAITNVVAASVAWGVCQFYAVRHLGRMPFLVASIKPAVAAITALGAAHFVPNPWVATAAAAGVYVVVALVIERALITDFSDLLARR
ncbi:MAG: flippase [Deltaproteobacteria bacterium]|jgi:PST family polysaccharide transporter